MLTKVRCPRCQYVVDKPKHKLPVCPKCGWGARRSGMGGINPVKSVYGNVEDQGRMARPIARDGKVVSPFGRPRDEATVMLLTAVTLTIYGLYFWSVHAFREIRSVHGRNYPWWRYMIGFVFPPMLFAHVFLEIGQMEYLRKEMRLSKGFGVAPFMGFWFLGAVLLTIAGVLLTFGVVPWGMGIFMFVLALLAFLELQMYVYGRAQRSLNELWNAHGITG